MVETSCIVHVRHKFLGVARKQLLERSLLFEFKLKNFSIASADLDGIFLFSLRKGPW